MKPDPNDKAGNPDNVLIVLADINNHMMSIRKTLGSNPAIATAVRGCDIRLYKDLMMGEEVRCFEAYVEATTHTGAVFCWSLDTTLTSLGWKFQRLVAMQTKDGEQTKIEFGDLTFQTFDSLANNYLAHMIEFGESAKMFDFNSG